MYLRESDERWTNDVIAQVIPQLVSMKWRFYFTELYSEHVGNLVLREKKMRYYRVSDNLINKNRGFRMSL